MIGPMMMFGLDDMQLTTRPL